MTTRTLRFNVVAPSAGVPSWASGAAVNRWVAIPGTVFDTSGQLSTANLVNVNTGTSVGQSNAIWAYGGAAFDRTNKVIWNTCGGGHAGWAGNEVYRLDLNHDTAQITRVTNPSIYCTDNAAYYDDVRNAIPGLPGSRHTTNGNWFDPIHNEVLMLHGFALWNGANAPQYVDRFLIGSNSWVTGRSTGLAISPALYPADGGAGNEHASAMDGNGDVWVVLNENQRGLARWNMATRTWTSFGDKSAQIPAGKLVTGCYDPVRSRLFFPSSWPDTAWTLDLRPAFLGTCAKTPIAMDTPGRTASFVVPTAIYEPTLDRYLVQHDQDAGNIHSINPDTWATTTLTTGGTKPPFVTGAGGNRPYTRMQYVADWSGIITSPGPTNQPWYFLRTH